MLNSVTFSQWCKPQQLNVSRHNVDMRLTHCLGECRQLLHFFSQGDVCQWSNMNTELSVTHEFFLGSFLCFVIFLFYFFFFYRPWGIFLWWQWRLMVFQALCSHCTMIKTLISVELMLPLWVFPSLHCTTSCIKPNVLCVKPELSGNLVYQELYLFFSPVCQWAGVFNCIQKNSCFKFCLCVCGSATEQLWKWLNLLKLLKKLT